MNNHPVNDVNHDQSLKMYIKQAGINKVDDTQSAFFLVAVTPYCVTSNYHEEQKKTTVLRTRAHWWNKSVFHCRGSAFPLEKKDT